MTAPTAIPVATVAMSTKLDILICACVFLLDSIDPIVPVGNAEAKFAEETKQIDLIIILLEANAIMIAARPAAALKKPWKCRSKEAAFGGSPLAKSGLFGCCNLLVLVYSRFWYTKEAGVGSARAKIRSIR